MKNSYILFLLPILTTASAFDIKNLPKNGITIGISQKLEELKKNRHLVLSRTESTDNSVRIKAILIEENEDVGTQEFEINRALLSVCYTTHLHSPIKVPDGGRLMTEVELNEIIKKSDSFASIKTVAPSLVKILFRFETTDDFLNYFSV